MKYFPFLLLFPLLCAAAQNADTFRPAEPGDLPGIWKQINVQSHDPELDLSDPWFTGSQYYWFKDPEANEQYVRIMIQTGEGQPLEEFLPTWKESPWQVNLVWGGNGETLMRFPVQNKRYPIVFTYYTEDFDTSSFPKERVEALEGKLPMKGDITLTYLNPQAKPQYFRLLRKVDIELPEEAPEATEESAEKTPE